MTDVGRNRGCLITQHSECCVKLPRNDEELAKELEAGWRKPTPTNQAAPAKSGHVVVMVEVADDQVGELRWEDG